MQAKGKAKMAWRGSLVWLAWWWLWAPAHAVTPVASPAFQSNGKWELTGTLTPRLGISDSEDIPFGVGVVGQFVAFPVERFGFGLEAGWSRHGSHDFIRAAMLLEVLIDDLDIRPFLQMGIGAQLRISPNQIDFTPDLHLGLGFDVPIHRRFSVGLSFQFFFPINIQAFPITKTLHLRLRLLF